MSNKYRFKKRDKYRNTGAMHEILEQQPTVYETDPKDDEMDGYGPMYEDDPDELVFAAKFAACVLLAIVTIFVIFTLILFK